MEEGKSGSIITATILNSSRHNFILAATVRNQGKFCSKATTTNTVGTTAAKGMLTSLILAPSVTAALARALSPTLVSALTFTPT